MFGANLVSAEQAEKWSFVGGGFDCRPALGLFPFHQTNHPNDVHPGFPCGFDGENGRSPGGADVVDHHDRSAWLGEALDAASRAVSLFRLPH